VRVALTRESRLFNFVESRCSNSHNLSHPPPWYCASYCQCVGPVNVKFVSLSAPRLLLPGGGPERARLHLVSCTSRAQSHWRRLCATAANQRACAYTAVALCEHRLSERASELGARRSVFRRILHGRCSKYACPMPVS
jgi:hypothetical protein